MFKSTLPSLAVLFLCLALQACATTSSNKKNSDDNNSVITETTQATPAVVNPDPFEKVNRRIFEFNQDFDDKILVPFARGYRKVLPKPVRIAVYNFFITVAEPRNIINSLLQGKIHNAVDAFSRLFVNVTLGMGGLVDIASKTGLERRIEDIGQTLAVWGYGFGPYIQIPILGPSSGRDIFGLYSYFSYEDPLGYLDDSTARFSLLVLDMVDTRSRYLRASTVFDLAAVDPYLFERESYFQTRIDMIYDGLPPIDSYDK